MRKRFRASRIIALLRAIEVRISWWHGDEEGLQVPGCHRARKRLYDHQPSILCMHPLYPNPVWSVEVIQDRLTGDAATGYSPSSINTRVRVGRCTHRFG